MTMERDGDDNARSLDQQFTFRLSADQHKRMQKVFDTATSGSSPRFYVLMALVFGLQVITQVIAGIERHRDFWLAGFSAVFLAVYGILAIRAARSPSRRLPPDGSLRLSAGGLAGTLDGTPSTIPWSSIETVHDFGDCLLVLRRRNQGAIAIPKSSIGDVATLWALLEDRLVSKRGLIRSPAPRTQILNSAY